MVNLEVVENKAHFIINDIVKECLKQHKGGENFFTLLDYNIQNNKDLILQMIDFITINYDYIIVSGNFGRAFYSYSNNYYTNIDVNKIIIVNGNLRKGVCVDKFWNFYNIQNKKTIFIDDSFYSGKTRNVIQKAVEEQGGKLIHTFCYYDGSKVKENNVSSFYRWYK